MKRTIGIIAVLGMMLLPCAALANPDEYVGDTAIYGGETAEVKPNVLFILDTSGSMDNEVALGGSYEPDLASPYAGICNPETVYKCTEFGLKCENWVSVVEDVDNVSCSFFGTNVQQILKTTGQWNSNWRKLNEDGSCSWGSGIYALGNHINWVEQTGGEQPKIEVAKEVLSNLVASTEGVNFGLMVFRYEDGARFFTSSAGYSTQVKDMDEIFSGTTTNREALVSAISGITAGTWTPLAESLFEAMRYYQGGVSEITGVDYTSPINASCQPNYVVLISDGMSTHDRHNALKNICDDGDCDGDGFEPAGDPDKNYDSYGSDYLDDVAHYLYHTDLSDIYEGEQNVSTYTVGFGLGGGNSGAVKLLEETAENGGGKAFLAESYGKLSSALTSVLGLIFETNSSFVAPVVPTSPENRTYSGSRVYLGFFRPMPDADWRGNIKKYGLDGSGNVVDKNGSIATSSSNGSFLESSVSYWTSEADGARVDRGGVGALLLNRDFSSAPRLIYSNLDPGEKNLTATANQFVGTNTAITPALLGVADDTAKNNLIHYIHGIDVYDDDFDQDTTDKREWILGDILHSKPAIVTYGTYSFIPSNENNPSVNKTMIYVGSNDGMLHAFRDADGGEEWAFIPDNLLPNLKNLHNGAHSYFIDGIPTVYTYDADNDGNIETGDKVILIFCQRRGGSAYYALDVTDPASPQFMWKVDAGTAGFDELGQTWSQPQLGKVKYDDSGTNKTKIVAFVGAGYDNDNEDGRFGNTQDFTDQDVVAPTGDSGNVTSSGTVTLARDGSSPELTNDPKGRGVYAIEIATLDGSGVPDFTESGSFVWGFTYAMSGTNSYDTSRLLYPIPSDVTVLDTDYDGYVDRLYVGDTGGQIWRICKHKPAVSPYTDPLNDGTPDPDPVINSWFGKRIFEANEGGDGSKGRKVFFRPSITLENGYIAIYFGTGDRAHPLNTAVTERLYTLYDRGQRTDEEIDQDNLVDVTTDLLQDNSATQTQISETLEALVSSYGWYIKLDQNSGEKVLASPLVFNKVVYYTTFTPNTPSTDPCVAGNLGTSRLYAIDYKTGESVLNFENTNDSESTEDNKRALSGDGSVLRRDDRSVKLGVGIPSGLVVLMPSSRDAKLLIGSGGGLCSEDPVLGGTIFPIYWKAW
jgi:type IV pilus assembly protein PilY1